MTRRLFIVVALLLTQSSAFGFSLAKKELREGIEVEQTKFLFGQEALTFCGGLVETWIEADIESSTAKVKVKVTPPSGTNWKLWNAHVIVEDSRFPGEPARFKGPESVDTSKDSTNVMPLTFDLRGLYTVEDLKKAAFKVAFRPFEGCSQGGEIKGLVLRHLPDAKF